jgi:hypothetical protein
MMFKTGNDNIDIVEGPDFLCEVCPHFNGMGCCHPKGSEEAVRKWDKIILQELDLRYGQIIKVKDAKSLIEKRAPLNFCLTKCRYYREKICNGCL